MNCSRQFQSGRTSSGSSGRRTRWTDWKTLEAVVEVEEVSIVGAALDEVGLGSEHTVLPVVVEHLWNVFSRRFLLPL